MLVGMGRHVVVVALLALISMGVIACSSSGELPKSSTKDGGTPPATTGAEDASAPSTQKDSGAPDVPDDPQSEDFSGEATYYDADGTGACGFGKSTDFLVAALNKVQYTKAECGKCARVTGPKGSVTIKIVDLCPGCGDGDLDLSETAFKQVANLDDGRVEISWHFSTCP